MSRCSKKCNEIKEKIDSIGGLDDDFVFEKLEKENAQLKEKYNKALSDLAEGTHKRIVKGAEDGTNN